jgi:hypothetical protein
MVDLPGESWQLEILGKNIKIVYTTKTNKQKLGFRRTGNSRRGNFVAFKEQRAYFIVKPASNCQEWNLPNFVSFLASAASHSIQFNIKDEHTTAIIGRSILDLLPQCIDLVVDIL